MKPFRIIAKPSASAMCSWFKLGVNSRFYKEKEIIKNTIGSYWQFEKGSKSLVHILDISYELIMIFQKSNFIDF